MIPSECDWTRCAVAQRSLGCVSGDGELTVKRTWSHSRRALEPIPHRLRQLDVMKSSRVQ